MGSGPFGSDSSQGWTWFRRMRFRFRHRWARFAVLHTSRWGYNVATWQQVKNYIYANYNVASDEGHMLTLVFETEGGRSQMITLGHVEADQFSSVVFSSPIAEWTQVSADRVLRATEEVPASIRSIGQFIVAAHNQLLATIDEAEIDLPLALLTYQADQLERYLGLGDRF